jgi:hypothetical protein
MKQKTLLLSLVCFIITAGCQSCQPNKTSLSKSDKELESQASLQGSTTQERAGNTVSAQFFEKIGLTLQQIQLLESAQKSCKDKAVLPTYIPSNFKLMIFRAECNVSTNKDYMSTLCYRVEYTKSDVAFLKIFTCHPGGADSRGEIKRDFSSEKFGKFTLTSIELEKLEESPFLYGHIDMPNGRRLFLEYSSKSADFKEVKKMMDSMTYVSTEK